MEAVEVDGSYGEGGGQILRVASAFSVIFMRPIHVRNIRAGRTNPGLRPQHLASLLILQSLTSGKLVGGEVGSTEIYFQPSEISKEKLEWDLKTAGSITLVLQTLVPAVSLARKYLEIDLRGGTDVPWSPTSDYFANVVLQSFSRIGVNFELDILSRGYYPKGGGRVRARIYPCDNPKSITLTEDPVLEGISIISRCGSLPEEVARRQADAAERQLLYRGLHVKEKIVNREHSISPGTSILVSCCNSTCFIGSDRIGERGVRAETVGSQAATRFLDLAETKSTVDPNLSDMLSPILALADGESEFYVPEITGHLRTSVYVASLFRDFDFSFKKDNGRYRVKIGKGSRG